ADRRSPAGRARRRRRRSRCARGDGGQGRRLEPLAGDAGHRQVSRLAYRHTYRARSVDPVDIVALTRALVDIDSTTGREGAAGRWLADCLRSHGWSVVEQPVDSSRFNVLATADPPTVVFSTHFDCVPPFFPSRIDGDRLYGR